MRRERFLREVRTTARIEHLGIPAVFDAGVDPATGRLFVVMQLLRGRELQTLIDETDHVSDPLPVARAAAIGAQIASVLHEVHQQDVVHRDIKPANLMLTPGGIVKVLDFGVASLLGSGSNPRLTQVGMTVGTPPYMSPEQSLANAVGPAADIYALACVLYEVLTGRPPFASSAEVSHLWHHVNTEPPQIRAVRPDVPAEVESLLLEMLRKQAEERPDSAEVYERLLPWASRAHGSAFPEDIRDLDPCLPFTRPFGGTVRRRSVPASTVPLFARPLTEEQIDEVSVKAEELLKAQQFVQAADLVADALSRTTDPAAANELTFKLANVKWLGGSFTEAAKLFERTAGYWTRRYGPDDPDARIARFFMAKCRAEMGAVTSAIEAFQNYVVSSPDSDDDEAIDRYVDALASLVRLHAASEHPERAHEAASAFRQAASWYRGATSPILADLDAYVARLDRLLPGN